MNDYNELYNYRCCHDKYDDNNNYYYDNYYHHDKYHYDR